MSPSTAFVGQVAFQPSYRPRPRVSHVVFDFDGTLSWLRHGWPEMMVEVMRETTPNCLAKPLNRFTICY